MSLESIAELEEFILGETEDELTVETSQEIRLALTAMVGQAQRQVDIMSRDLDHAIYDDAEFVDAAKQLALGSSRARIRILVQRPEPMVQRGHRLLALARRLSSYISIRVPAAEHASYNSAFLVADGSGTMFRGLADLYDGTIHFNNPLEAKRLTDRFDEMWDRANEHPDLRGVRL